MEAFELAFFNKVTKQKDLLNHDTKLCDLEITEYLVIHVDVLKTTVEPDFIKETASTDVETRVRKIVKKPVDAIKAEKAVVAAVEKVAEAVVDKAVVEKVAEEKVAEAVVDKAEKVENAVEMVVNEKPELVVDDVKTDKVNTEEEVVKKKFCIVC